MAHTCKLTNNSKKSDMKVTVLTEMLNEGVTLIEYAAKHPSEENMKKWFGAEAMLRRAARI